MKSKVNDFQGKKNSDCISKIAASSICGGAVDSSLPILPTRIERHWEIISFDHQVVSPKDPASGLK